MFSKITKAGVASIIVGAAASTALLSAAPANAAQSLTKQLVPGESLCVAQYAGYQVRVDGVSNKPLHFRVFRKRRRHSVLPGLARVRQRVAHLSWDLPRTRHLQGLRRQQHHREQPGHDQHPHRRGDLTTLRHPMAVTPSLTGEGVTAFGVLGTVQIGSGC
jgi:hypothetical protein